MSEQREILKHIPMVYAAVMMIVGVAFATFFILPLWFTLTSFIACGFVTLLLKNRLSIMIMLFMLGVFTQNISYKQRVPTSNDDIAALHIEIKQGRWSQLEGWYDKSGAWHRSGALLFTTIDSTLNINSGERVVLKGGYKRLASASNKFETSILRQGTKGYLYIHPRNILHHKAAPFRLRHYLRGKAIERINELQLSDESRALVSAVTIAERSDISSDVNLAYRRSGLNHLLAISGLHMGIVVLIANFAFGWMPLMRDGQVIKCIFIIATLWLFALITGLPVSVARAAILFTTTQLSVALSRQSNPINALAFAAVVVMLFSPASIWSISFQLSFIASAAILLIYKPLLRILRTPYKAVNIVVSPILVGVIASLSLLPIVSHTFGYVSLFSPLTTLLVIPFLHITITSIILWMVAPIALLKPLAERVIEWSTTTQNQVVMFASQHDMSYLKYEVDGRILILYYALFCLSAWGIIRWSEVLFKKDIENKALRK